MHRTAASLRAPIAAVLALVALASAAHAANTRAFVTCTDFSAGEMSVVQLSNRAVTPGVQPVHTDAVVRWYNGKVYVVNRAGQDNIQVMDPALNYAVVGNHSTGNGSNPYDIVFVSSTKAYIPRYNEQRLLVMNPGTGATITTIDLSAFADADGIPEMARAIRVQRWLFVAVQRLDRNNFYAPTDSSQVVVIDTQTDQVVDADPAHPGVQGIVLPVQNPITDFSFDRVSSRLLIGCSGALFALDGGVAAIDPVFFENLGLTISEAQLGGEITDIEWMNATRSFAIVSDPSFNTRLIAWNDVTNTASAPIFSPGGYSLTDVAGNDLGELYVCHSNLGGAYGLYVFRASDGAFLAGPLDTGLPPYAISFDNADEVLGVSPSTASVALSAPRPNPARDHVEFQLTLARETALDLEVVDATGRRVTTIASARIAAGTTSWFWNLRDRRQTPVGAGLYWIRTRGGDVNAMQRCVVVR